MQCASQLLPNHAVRCPSIADCTHFDPLAHPIGDSHSQELMRCLGPKARGQVNITHQGSSMLSPNLASSSSRLRFSIENTTLHHNITHHLRRRYGTLLLPLANPTLLSNMRALPGTSISNQFTILALRHSLRDFQPSSLQIKLPCLIKRDFQTQLQERPSELLGAPQVL